MNIPQIIPTSFVCLLFFPLLLYRIPAKAQSDTEKVQTLIRKLGWGTAYQQEDTLLLILENQNFRFDPQAVSESIREANISSPFIQLHLARQGLPFSAIQLTNVGANIVATSADIYRADSKETYPDLPQYQLLQFILRPRIKFALGNINDPEKIQLGIIPEVSLSFWRGMSLRAQIILPLYNELENVPEEEVIRPGLIMLSQYLQLPFGGFTQLSAGYFTNNRYGLQAGIYRYFLEGRLLITGEAGLTGFLSYPKFLLRDEPEPGWQRGSMEYLTYALGLSYRVHRYDLTTALTYRKFLFNQEGLEFSIGRQFDEWIIEFYAQTSVLTDKENFGLSLRIPIPGSGYKRIKKGNVLLRTGRYLDITYSGISDLFFQFESGNDFSRFSRNVNPGLLLNQFNN